MEIALKAPDFILAGRASDLEKWPDIASKAGVLWCYKNQQGKNDLSFCDHKHGCGISDGLLIQKAISISGAAGFDNKSHEHLLLLTPSKRNSGSSPASLRMLVLKLLVPFQDCSVACYESSSFSTGAAWVPFDIDRLRS